MTRTRGPAVYGHLYLDDYEEENVAWSWAKGMMRKKYPRCSFKQNPHAVIAFKHGEPVAMWFKDTMGAEVSL